jgi:3-hydroxybutyrate dehydrogenase
MAKARELSSINAMSPPGPTSITPMAAAEHAFGGVDIICPGAGVFEPPFSNFWIPPGTGKSADVTADSRYKIHDINVTHPIRLMQLAIGHFVSKGKPGNVVRLASIAGHLAFAPVPLYCASKQGREDFGTRSTFFYSDFESLMDYSFRIAIADFVRSIEFLEPRYGIRVTAVAPGVVRTVRCGRRGFERLEYLSRFS